MLRLKYLSAMAPNSNLIRTKKELVPQIQLIQAPVTVPDKYEGRKVKELVCLWLTEPD